MSSVWEKTEVNLGNIKEGSINKFTYLLINPKKISRVSPGCSGCTKVKLENNVLKVTYKASRIPVHIRKSQNFQYVTKYITVFYEDNTNDILKFRAKINK